MNHRDWDTAHLRPLEDRDIVRGTFVVALRGTKKSLVKLYRHRPLDSIGTLLSLNHNLYQCVQVIILVLH